MQMFDNEPYESNNEYLDESDDVLYISICMVICFCKCKLFPFFPRFVIVTYYLGVFNKCDNGNRRVFVRPVKIKMVD